MTLEKLKHEKRTACLRREDVKSAHFPLFPLCRSRGFTSKGENQRRRKIQTRNDFIYFVYLIYLKLFVLSLQSCFLSCAVAVVLLLCFDFVLSSKTFQINTIYTLKRLRICLLVCFQEQQEGTFWCCKWLPSGPLLVETSFSMISLHYTIYCNICCRFRKHHVALSTLYERWKKL